MIPGSGRSPGGGCGNPLQYSCQENPMDRGAWRDTVHGVGESDTQLKHLSPRARAHTHTHTHTQTHSSTEQCFPLSRHRVLESHLLTQCGSHVCAAPSPSWPHSAGRPPFPHPSCRPSCDCLPHPQGQALSGARKVLWTYPTCTSDQTVAITCLFVSANWIPETAWVSLAFLFPAKNSL